MIMSSHGPKWLHTLCGAPYAQARDALLTLPGVGPKVAIQLTQQLGKCLGCENEMQITNNKNGSSGLLMFSLIMLQI